MHVRLSTNWSMPFVIVVLATFVSLVSCGCTRDPEWLAKLKALPVSGELVRKHDDRGGQAAAFSPDGKLLCVGYGEKERDKLLSLWDVEGLRHVADLEGHRHDIRAVAFSPDGQLLATVSRDATMRIWDVATRKTLHVMTFPRGSSDAVAFSSNGHEVASASEASLYIWDCRTGVHLGRGEAQGIVTAVVHSARHDKWIVGDRHGGITVLDGRTRKPVFEKPPYANGTIENLTVSETGCTLLACNSHVREITVWSVGEESLKLLTRLRLGTDRPALYAALTPDGKNAIAAFGDDRIGILVFRCDTGMPVARIPDSPYKIFVSPKNGHCLFLAPRKKAVLWKVPEAK